MQPATTANGQSLTAISLVKSAAHKMNVYLLLTLDILFGILSVTSILSNKYLLFAFSFALFLSIAAFDFYKLFKKSSKIKSASVLPTQKRIRSLPSKEPTYDLR